MDEIETLSSQNLFDIRGRNALITGGTSGIGLMMAKGLIINGIETLYITGHDQQQLVAKSKQLCSFVKENKFTCKVYGYQTASVYGLNFFSSFLADFRQPKHIETLSKEIRRTTDHLDILLSNAGIRRDPQIPIKNYNTASLEDIQESLLSHSPDGWRDTFSVNTTAHFFINAHFLDLLAASAQTGEGRGCVVVTSSCASMHLCTNVDLMSYAASKAATDHVVAMLAAKLGRFGIRVNGINPGCSSPPLPSPFLLMAAR